MAAGLAFNILLVFEQLYRRRHRTTPLMSQDQYQLYASNDHAVLNPAKRLAADNVTCNANAEYIPDAQLEDQFGWNVRVDATKNRGKRRLATGSRTDLATEVPRKPIA